MDSNGILFAEGKAAGPQIEFVDLGLSVKWGKALIGATNGDTAESWYGNYYAWGETEPNKTNKDGNIYYDWTNYKYANGSSTTMTKYCTNKIYGNDGFTDELTQLVPEDDVATQTNSAWRMPTKVECSELMALPSKWITNYNGISGLNGRVFEGKNRNHLFIPAAGYRYDNNISNVGSDCYLWSSSLYLVNPFCAYHLGFYSSNVYNVNKNRCNGFSVCPVLY